MRLLKTARTKIKLLLLLVTASFLFGCEQQDKAISDINTFISESDIDTSKGGWKRELQKPPKLTFDPAKQYLWVLDTNKGKIVVELKAQQSPMHVSSTIYLTTLGFYDTLAFHRVIPGFMLQGGDPLGNGQGGPGYTYMGEFESDLKHDKAGILSMANTGRASSDGSQFFITFNATPHLNGRHTVFGQVIEGMDTLKKLEKFGSSKGKTSEKLFIQKATIVIK